MRKKISLLFCLTVLTAACIKNAVDTPGNSSIKGTWELRATRNGNIMPATYSPGNGHLLVFENTTFIQYTAGTIVDRGHYSKSTDSTYKYSVFLTFSNWPFVSHILLKADTLELIPGHPDFATSLYVKKGN